MNGNEQFAIGDKVRSKKTGFIGVVRMIVLGGGFSHAIVTEGSFLISTPTLIEISDLERFGVTDVPCVENGVKITPPKGMEDIGGRNYGFLADTEVVFQGNPAKPKTAENIVIGIDLKVSDEGKAMLDKLQLAAENAKAVGLTSGSTEPKGLHPHEKDAIKQALLDAAKQGSLNERTADMLIEQFQQVDAA
ncbi:hypothetical protein [Microvirgula aerodenitrificans]|uniref:hypothetical protein n=1 Tax=Microvirgula aerodenitrificans TaxID=57480 RepID=UPI00248DD4D2|nr:hypothetical protein [Microvirgula aerodenitrificans]